MSKQGLTAVIVEKINNLHYDDLSTEVINTMDRAMMDTIGIAHMGYEFMGAPFVTYSKQVGGIEEATLIADGGKTSAGLAAGINSTLAYNSNMMESGPGDHLFDAVAHTGIALGEKLGCSGAEVITAVALAYELNAIFYKSAQAKDRHGYVNTKKHTPVCVAMCAGKLMGLDPDALNNAISIAWMIEPPAMDLSLKFNVFTGLGSMYNLMICQLGVQAALLTKYGVKGPRDVIEKDVLYDLDQLKQFSLVDCYHVAHELHLKPWLGSRTSTGAIQLVLEIAKENAINVDEIEQVTVNAHRFYQNYPFSCVEPHSYFEGCFSVQWIVANALLGYEPGPLWVLSDAFLDQRRQELAKKVVIGEHPEAVEMWASGKALGNPEVPIEAIIKARGKEYIKSMKYRHIRGSPENPMSQAELDSKFLRLVNRVVPEKKAEALLAGARKISEVANLREMAARF